jgi:hypothetical protein
MNKAFVIGLNNWVNHIRCHIKDPKEIERSLKAIETLVEIHDR